MRLASIVLAALVLFSTPLLAHPGAGLVVDNSGRIFFVRIGDDRIWTLEKGKPQPYVSDPRIRLPHRLVLDRAGNLYTASDDDGKVWRIAPDKSITLHYASKDQRLWVGSGGDPFTIDAAGNVIGLNRASDRVSRSAPDGRITELGRGARFSDLHYGAIAAAPDGSVYVAAGGVLKRLTDSSATLVTTVGGSSRITGLAVDSAGNVYIADYGLSRVVKLGANGGWDRVAGFDEASVREPLGVAIGPDGSPYVLALPQDGFALWKGGGADAQRLFLRTNPRIVIAAVFFTLVTGLLALQTIVRIPKGRLDWAVWSVFAGIVIAAGYYVGSSMIYFEHIRHIVALLFVAGLFRSFKASSATAS